VVAVAVDTVIVVLLFNRVQFIQWLLVLLQATPALAILYFLLQVGVMVVELMEGKEGHPMV
jgi:hypothetical protein